MIQSCTFLQSSSPGSSLMLSTTARSIAVSGFDLVGEVVISTVRCSLSICEYAEVSQVADE